jgi:hypothetical protein
MLKKLCLLSIMVLSLTIMSTSKTQAQEVTLDYFYDQLEPYGHWDNMGELGWVWKPYGTRPGWRPYSDGYWVYTEFGWTYQADNQWGWAVYHYGRWTFLDNYGWAWVPGTEWAPAWVAWRNDDDHIGWAPLPPKAEWSVGIGLHSNFNINVDIHWSDWSFVSINHFDDPKVGIYIESSARNVTYIQHTRNITRYDYENQHIINHCIDADRWEHISHRPVVRYSVVDAPSYQRVGINRSPSQHEIRVYRPQIHSRQPEAAPRHTEDRHDLSSTRSYEKERSRTDKHYDQEYHRLVETQHREETAPNHNKEEIQRQHNAEIDAYREQRNRETKVLETRHVNDMDRAEHKNTNHENRDQPAEKSKSDHNRPAADKSSDNNKSDNQNSSSRRR